MDVLCLANNALAWGVPATQVSVLPPKAVFWLGTLNPQSGNQPAQEPGTQSSDYVNIASALHN